MVNQSIRAIHLRWFMSFVSHTHTHLTWWMECDQLFWYGQLLAFIHYTSLTFSDVLIKRLSPYCHTTMEKLLFGACAFVQNKVFCLFYFLFFCWLTSLLLILPHLTWFSKVFLGKPDMPISNLAPYVQLRPKLPPPLVKSHKIMNILIEIVITKTVDIVLKNVKVKIVSPLVHSLLPRQIWPLRYSIQVHFCHLREWTLYFWLSMGSEHWM